MGIRFFKEIELKNPVLIACWPGIGNIGLLAVDTLRKGLGAEEFAEIEPWDFFYPRKLTIRNGQIMELEFPHNKFYFKQTEKTDLIFFLAEEQPAWAGHAYAEGTEAFKMANLVIDIAEKFNCCRIITSGAAVASIHHVMKPRVWAVPNSRQLIPELQKYENTVLMSDIEGRSGEGNITGLNGLLLGVARKRGIDALCLMGEIPVYLQSFPILYPKASKSVVEILCKVLGIGTNLSDLNEFAERSEREINRVYDELPSEAREHLDKLKNADHFCAFQTGTITEDDKRKILEDVDTLFKKKTLEDEN